MCVCVCARVCVHVCACVCMCVFSVTENLFVFVIAVDGTGKRFVPVFGCRKPWSLYALIQHGALKHITLVQPLPCAALLRVDLIA